MKNPTKEQWIFIVIEIKFKTEMNTHKEKDYTLGKGGTSIAL